MRDDDRLSPVLDHLRPLLGQCAELHQLRSWVVHSICQGTDLEGQVIFGMSAQKRGVSYTDRHIAFTELEAAAAKMRTMNGALEEAFQRLRDAVASA